MVDEARAVQADLAARATFTPEGKPIYDTRHVIAEAIAAEGHRPTEIDTVAHTAARLAAAAADDFIEVG